MTQGPMTLSEGQGQIIQKKYKKNLTTGPFYFTHRLYHIYYDSFLWLIWALPSCFLILPRNLNHITNACICNVRNTFSQLDNMTKNQIPKARTSFLHFQTSPKRSSKNKDLLHRSIAVSYNSNMFLISFIKFYFWVTVKFCDSNMVRSLSVWPVVRIRYSHL